MRRQLNALKTAHLVAEEATGYVDLLASNDYDLLPGEDLLGDNRSETSQEMTFAINDNWT